MYKSHTCGEIRASHSGQIVTLAGWVNRRRDHGGVVFIDLRDRFGMVQVVFNPDLPQEYVKIISTIRLEWVLQITGTVRKRPEGMINPKLDTGEIEIIADKLTVLNPAKALPFMINGDDQLAH